MLRQLPDSLVGTDYDMDFLQKNCAVCDDSGKINDLYIAMSEDTISWAELKNVSKFMDGLEAAWLYDQLLDGPENSENTFHDSSRPAAGDIIPAWSPTSTRSPMKRKECEITRSSSFGSSADSDGSRQKMRRQFPDTTVEVAIKRRAERV